MKSTRLGVSLLAVLLMSAATGCDGVEKIDDASKTQLTDAGFSDSVATRLGTMKMSSEELTKVIESRKVGISETMIADMVARMHEQDLRYEYISNDMQMMMLQNIGATAQTQLIDMGAVPAWTNDIMALKVEGAADVTIVEIARLKFKEKKEVLSGSEYAMLKRRGFSDSGLLEFVNKGGNAQQLQRVADEIQLGKSEQEAMKVAGL